ncbi:MULTISPECIES: TIGR00341 family protein [unclassified Nodularia (in: cyanobacteria)]|uniref:TIGR00341 family protein n=1 Tax=unclassified Nodularia (in: cyanobacteria) TaxID=2656917 RepID=UPI00187F7D92|nr:MULTISPECIES: TIGR00341 family protein [unclassified Nodularia (in: cyanobacteria)]MBE9201628.1 TIGR00341 family protein [Nodularia sp. LEGE 06071]MCC2691904.1 TIGR00341 family protein [Nodularia sp. LEGE 04288]
MRQLIIQVPRGNGKAVINIAKSHNGSNLARFEGNADEPIDVVIVHVSNREVGKVLEELQDLPKVQITIIPTGVMALQPPVSETPQQVIDVEERSPIEIFLSGLQSVGSWRGFLGYAVLAGFVVWIGLYTNTTYLLVAAMLIAPFAGPAMNTAIGTAWGDRKLLGRSILRYFAALAVTIITTCLLSLVLRQEIPTSLMVENSQISAVAVILPLAAGAAGALNLVQSERSSLVSGAATGMLVAASLAPPAGIIGMASAVGRWDMVISGLFLLFLQLCGINLSAALLFRVFGLSPQGTRYQRGKKQIFFSALVITVIGLGGLLSWQFINSPNLQRSSLAQRANAEVQKTVEEVGLAELVESNVRFTRANIAGQNTLLCVIYVQRQPQITASSEEIRDRLTQSIQTQLLKQNFNATPLVDVNVLETPVRLQ